MSTSEVSWGLGRPVPSAENFTTLPYRLSWNMETSAS